MRPREIGLIRVKQEIKGIAAHGAQLGGIDWEKLAQSFGADGVTVETQQALANALQTALKSKRTTVIGVRIDASGYVAQFNAWLTQLSSVSSNIPRRRASSRISPHRSSAEILTAF
jgi:thiamine pyrophosphate-dependent acetolactate synthase large subunit-like protein